MYTYKSRKSTVRHIVKGFIILLCFYVGFFLVFLSGLFFGQQETPKGETIERVVVKHSDEDSAAGSNDSNTVVQGEMKLMEVAPVSPVNEVKGIPH